MALTPGARLGSYEVIAAIGAGGMGEVYRARDSKLKREVAIKVLPAPVAADAERLARFQREAEVLASLNHPNVAHVYGFEGTTLPEGSTAHFLAMELVLGEDLSERLRPGPSPSMKPSPSSASCRPLNRPGSPGAGAPCPPSAPPDRITGSPFRPMAHAWPPSASIPWARKRSGSWTRSGVARRGSRQRWGRGSGSGRLTREASSTPPPPTAGLVSPFSVWTRAARAHFSEGGSREPQPYMATPAYESSGRISPDVKLAAFVSDESGRDEVYIASFPTPGERTRVSSGGGTGPRWRGDSKEIFYLAPDGAMMAATVTARDGRAWASPPKPLFRAPPLFDGRVGGGYDVSADGQRFLMNLATAQGSVAPITVVLNWKSDGPRGKP